MKTQEKKKMLSYAVYRHKLQGRFTGKAVGGTLGLPMEGYFGITEVSYYDPVPTKMLENDDLDLQVVWLEVIRRCGLPINRRDLADGWLDHMREYPDEYGIADRNLSFGLYPPLSGAYDNKFGSGMGAAIRTELWACLAPGDPALAVSLSREDACNDHYGDGMEAVAFLTAVESAAFVESDRQKLIDIGLSFLPKEGRLHRIFTSVLRWWAECRDPYRVRELVLENFFDPNWTYVGINLAFILIAWLHGGDDFGKCLCTAASLGHDTDCTTATLGAILGILDPDGFEERWTKPLGNELVLSGCISAMYEADTIDGLCDRIAELCGQVLSFYDSAVRLDEEPKPLPETERAAKPWAPSAAHLPLAADYDPRESLVAVRPLILKLRYPDAVAIAPGECAPFTAKIADPAGGEWRGRLRLNVPSGWRTEPSEWELTVPAGEEVCLSFTVTAPENPKRRVAKTELDFCFTQPQTTFRLTAGLIPTYDFLRKRADYDSDDCPSDAFMQGAEPVNARAHFQAVPDGQHVFMTEIRVSEYYPHTVMVAQGTRPIKVWLDGKLVLSHDGAEYVPAFHRSDNVAQLALEGGWHRLCVWTGEKERDIRCEHSPHSAVVPIRGTVGVFEARKRYDRAALECEGAGELFIGFVNRSGWKWLTDMEFRLPKLTAAD